MAENSWLKLRIRIMCLSGVTFLQLNCCFNKLTLKNLTKCVGLVQSIHHNYHTVKCITAKKSAVSLYKFVFKFNVR